MLLFPLNDTIYRAVAASSRLLSSAFLGLWEHFYPAETYRSDIMTTQILYECAQSKFMSCLRPNNILLRHSFCYTSWDSLSVSHLSYTIYLVTLQLFVIFATVVILLSCALCTFDWILREFWNFSSFFFPLWMSVYFLYSQVNEPNPNSTIVFAKIICFDFLPNYSGIRVSAPIISATMGHGYLPAQSKDYHPRPDCHDAHINSTINLTAVVDLFDKFL